MENTPAAQLNTERTGKFQFEVPIVKVPSTDVLKSQSFELVLRWWRPKKN
jgi:hypothetical protein